MENVNVTLQDAYLPLQQKLIIDEEEQNFSFVKAQQVKNVIVQNNAINNPNNFDDCTLEPDVVLK